MNSPLMEQTTKSARNPTKSIVSTILAISLVVALLVTIPATQAQTSTPETRATLSGSCIDLVARVEVPAERIEHRLPEGFTLLEVAGATTVQLVAAHCTVYMGGEFGGESTDMDYAALIVDLETPSGSYDLWELTNNWPWHSVSTEAGKFSPMVRGLTFDISTDPLTGEPTSVHQDVPWIQSPYTMEGLVVPRSAGPPPDLHFATDHWWGGPRGATHRNDDNSAFSAYSALATIDPAPGSELAMILGSDEPLAVPGLLLPFRAVWTWCGPGDIDEVVVCPPSNTTDGE